MNNTQYRGQNNTADKKIHSILEIILGLQWISPCNPQNNRGSEYPWDGKCNFPNEFGQDTDRPICYWMNENHHSGNTQSKEHPKYRNMNKFYFHNSLTIAIRM